VHEFKPLMRGRGDIKRPLGRSAGVMFAGAGGTACQISIATSSSRYLRPSFL
jgi:hypothetical protein